jgi:hypothetical protein
MDRRMTEGAPETRRLVRAARRRLVAASTVATARRAGWAAAAVASAGGIAHLATGAPLGAWTAVAALAVVALPTAAALVARRPTLAEAALRADAWLGTHTLLTSALDQLDRPPAARAGAAAVVLAQSETTAAAARPRLAGSAPPAGGRRLGAPLAVGLAAAFLQLVPVSGGATPEMPRELLDAAPPAAAPVVRPSRVEAGDAGAMRAGQGGRRPGVVAPEGAPETASADRPGAGTGAGVPGGTAPGSGAALPGARAGAGPTPALEWLDVPRTPGGAEGRTPVPVIGVPVPLPRVAGGAPVPRAAGTGARAAQSPALRAWAAAYLRGGEEGE